MLTRLRAAIVALTLITGMAVATPVSAAYYTTCALGNNNFHVYLDKLVPGGISDAKATIYSLYSTINALAGPAAPSSFRSTFRATAIVGFRSAGAAPTATPRTSGESPAAPPTAASTSRQAGPHLLSGTPISSELITTHVPEAMSRHGGTQ